MTQPTLPLEIKTLVIRELSPFVSIFCPSYVGMTRNEVAAKWSAYFRDLRTVCLVWPDTIAVCRKIIFQTISIRAHDQNIDASLRNLCQALENDPALSTYVTMLKFSWNPNGLSRQNTPFIPTGSQPLFLSFLSFVPKMHKLRILRLDGMQFDEDTSIELLHDLRVLKESSVMYLALCNCTFSISALHTFLGYWKDMGLPELSVEGVSILPHTTYSDHMLFEVEEDTWDWDDEDTWTEWDVDDKPRTTSSLSVSELDLKFSGSHRWGMLMLMDLLASNTWSPLEDVDCLQISAEGLAMTDAIATRINNLIDRYDLFSLTLNDFRQFDEAIHIPLNFGDVSSVDMAFSVYYEDFSELDELRFNWYCESLGAVPPDSKLREIKLRLHPIGSLEARDFGSRGVWGVLDSVLCGDNLQLDTLTIEVSLARSPSGSGTSGLAQFHTWLMKTCFRETAAKYFECNKEETEEKEMSALKLWIGLEEYHPKKQ